MNASYDFLLDHLRTAYGVTDAKVETGGKHRRCVFIYNGKTIKRTLSITPSDGNYQKVVLHDIRHVLGEPINPQPCRERRTLAAMTAELAPKPNGQVVNEGSKFVFLKGPTYIGSLALYAKGKVLSFTFPEEALAAFNADYTGPPGVDMGFIAPDLFTFRHTLKDKPKLTTQSQRGGSMVWERIGAFAATPTEITVAGGVLNVRLAEVPRKLAASAVKPPEDITPTPTAEPINKPLSATEVDMRTTLAAIRSIEALTPYRLVRVAETKAWAWRAPLITLEDEG